MNNGVMARVPGGPKVIVLLLVLCVSLVLPNWTQAGSLPKGVDQIQPYETEQGRTNIPEPSYQEYTPPNGPDSWGNQSKTQNINQSEADRIASQKAQKHPEQRSGATPEAGMQKYH